MLDFGIFWSVETGDDFVDVSGVNSVPKAPSRDVVFEWLNTFFVVSPVVALL